MQKNIKMNEEILLYVKDKELFWLKDLRIHMKIESTETSDAEYNKFINIIGRLKRNNIIQCCGSRGSERQYLYIAIII